MIAALGLAVETQLLPDDTGTWTYLLLAWLAFTPLWAVTTAWLSDARSRRRSQPRWCPLVGVSRGRRDLAVLVAKRFDRALGVGAAAAGAMCASAIALMSGGIVLCESWTWIRCSRS